MEQNPALVSSRLAADIARDTVRSTAGGFAPSVDLVAGQDATTTAAGDARPNLATPTSYANSRRATASRSALQFSLNLNGLGYGNYSRTRQSQYRWIAAKDRLERTSRTTERQARDAYLSVTSEISRVQALQPGAGIEPHGAGRHRGRLRSRHPHHGRRAQLAPAAGRRRKTHYSAAKYAYLNNLITLQPGGRQPGPQHAGTDQRWLAPAARQHRPRRTVVHSLRAASSRAISSSAPSRTQLPQATRRRWRGRRAAAPPADRRTAACQLGCQIAGPGSTTDQSARFAQAPRDFRCVGIVRTGEHRLAEHGRLQQVVTAHRHQAAADEGHVARRVPGQQRAHLVDQQHVDLRHRSAGGSVLRANAKPAAASSRATSSKRCGCRGTSTSSGARCRHAAAPWRAAALRGQADRLLAGVRAARNPQRPPRCPVRAPDAGPACRFRAAVQALP